MEVCGRKLALAIGRKKGLLVRSGDGGVPGVGGRPRTPFSPTPQLPFGARARIIGASASNSASRNSRAAASTSWGGNVLDVNSP